MRPGLAGQRQVLGVSPEVMSIPVAGPSQADGTGLRPLTVKRKGQMTDLESSTKNKTSNVR